MTCEKCGRDVRGTVSCPQFPGQVICTGCCMGCGWIIGRGTSVIHCGYISLREAVETE